MAAVAITGFRAIMFLGLTSAAAADVTTFRGHESSIQGVCILGSSGRIVTGSGDSTVRIWDAKKGLSKVLKGHEDSVTSVAGAPDGSWIVSASRDGTIRRWSTDKGEEVA